MTFMLPKADARAFAQKTAQFCLDRRSGPVFEGWSADKVFAYCGFCLLRRMCACAVVDGQIVTVAFGWPVWAEHVEARAAAGAPEFTWNNPIRGGDSIFIAEVIGQRRYLRTLWDTLGEWCPDIDERRVFTYRRKTLVELPQAVLQRLIYGQRTQHP